MSVYDDPQALRWIDSFEGVPPYEAPKVAPRGVAGWRPRANALFAQAGESLPGVALALGLALVGEAAARWVGEGLLGFPRSPVSPVMLAIVAGLLVRNVIGLPAVYDAGLRLCLRTVLRVGVAFLGIRLSLAAVGSIGLLALPIVLACIAVSLVLALGLARWMSLPPRLAVLIAVGTGICGNSAIMATAPLIDAEDDEVSYAVGCISLFGMMALLVYPFLSLAMFGGDGRLAGLFLGTAIHDTAQVAGAGMVYLQQYGDATALDTATVTKLLRNLCMLGVVPLMGVVYHRAAARRRAHAAATVPWRKMIPLFVVGFLALSALRTVGDLGDRPLGFLGPEAWERLIKLLTDASTWCLAVAMAGVGLSTSVRRLRHLGLRPLMAALAAALVVGAVGAVLACFLPRV
jgi:uncharacterized integral membrane protein (TIGR00698 family)